MVDFTVNWRRTPTALVGIAALVLVGLLVLFGVQLHATQATARRDVETRFRLRAEVTSALTQAVFSSAAAAPDTAKRYGAAVVSGQVLDRAAQQSGLQYQALFSDEGRLIAGSSGLTPADRSGLQSRLASIERDLRRAPFAVSDVLAASPGGARIIEFSVAFPTAHGRRILVGGMAPGSISAFIGNYLKRIPTDVGLAYVVDGRGNVIGTSGGPAVVGRPVAEPGLFAAAQRGRAGSFGRDGYFVAVRVPGTSWRVVLTAPRSNLFTSVSGPRRSLPWVIFAAFGIAALASLVLLRRLLGSRAALAHANSELTESNVKLESTNALLRHAAELTRSNAELERFASIASHDLQEPLRKVQTFAAELNVRERDRLSEEGQDFLRRMTLAAGRMRALIDDLLMFSRVSTQGRPFVAVDLGEALTEVLVDVELSIEETGARVSVDDLPTIDADAVQMRQLLQNLVGNALKFRRDGVVPEINITARVTDGIADLTVADNGIGFEPQYAARIFRAFERLHGASAYPGTGIGLALCYKIVERHHGTITADGSPGAGSVFHVRLPVHQPGTGPGEPPMPPDMLPHGGTFDAVHSAHA
jgi:signal transduction histidine kinase